MVPACCFNMVIIVYLTSLQRTKASLVQREVSAEQADGGIVQKHFTNSQ